MTPKKGAETKYNKNNVMYHKFFSQLTSGQEKKKGKIL